ncbi:MAG: DUF1987 domain-containing protein [Bacteroidia bacterium]|nr:DUF1987 domain-containing protein [Bacteroidia bacterium]
MENLFMASTLSTPEIRFFIKENIFRISGTSRPVDVRAFYYPIIDWVKELADEIINKKIVYYSKSNPLRFQVDFVYFNSSSAKLLYDIFSELKRIHEEGIPVKVEWFYEKEDTDMLYAGEDFAILAEMDFVPVAK